MSWVGGSFLRTAECQSYLLELAMYHCEISEPAEQALCKQTIERIRQVSLAQTRMEPGETLEASRQKTCLSLGNEPRVPSLCSSVPMSSKKRKKEEAAMGKEGRNPSKRLFAFLWGWCPICPEQPERDAPSTCIILFYV